MSNEVPEAVLVTPFYDLIHYFLFTWVQHWSSPIRVRFTPIRPESRQILAVVVPVAQPVRADPVGSARL